MKNGTVQLRDAATKRIVRIIHLKHSANQRRARHIKKLEFSEDGQSLIITRQNRTVTYYYYKTGRLQPGNEIPAKRRKDQKDQQRFYSPDGKIFASLDDRGDGIGIHYYALSLFKTLTGKRYFHSVDYGGLSYIIEYGPFANELTCLKEVNAWGTADRDIITFDTRTGKIKRTIQWRQQGMPNDMMDWSISTGHYLVLRRHPVYEEGDIPSYTIDLKNGHPLGMLPPTVSCKTIPGYR